MVAWVVFAVFALGFAGLCARYAMIEAAMIKAVLTVDPTFRPRYWAYASSPAERTSNAREYRRQLPDGPLAAKLRHVEWALLIWTALAFLAVMSPVRAL
jgi:hypothetical protein